MSNKLKDVFSNQMFEMGGKVKFKDVNAHKKFLEALKIVYDEGKTVEVDDIEEITTTVNDGDIQYPLMVSTKVDKFVVGPSIEEVSLDIETTGGVRTALFCRYETSSNIILEFGKRDCVYMKFAFEKDMSKVNFTYRMQKQFIKGVKHVLECYTVATGILNRIFDLEKTEIESDERDLLKTIISSFKTTQLFWEKVSLIENEIKDSFDPCKIENIDDIIQDVEELFLLLVKKIPVRVNAKLQSSETTGITLASNKYKPEIGKSIDITFVQEKRFTIGGIDIVVYTANLLTNAVIKKITTTKKGETKILYGDTDSKPMYISCTGYLSEEKAVESVKLIMKNGLAEKYKNAITAVEHYQKEIDGILS